MNAISRACNVHREMRNAQQTVTPFQLESFKVEMGHPKADQNITSNQIFTKIKRYGVGSIRLTRDNLQWRTFANFLMGPMV